MRRTAVAAMLAGAAVVASTGVAGILIDRHAQLTATVADQALVQKAHEQVEELEEHFERSKTVVLMLAHDASFAALAEAPGAAAEKAAAGGPLVDRANSALTYLETLYPTSIGEACFIDETGTEFARVVNGVVAPASELSSDEAQQPFFAPTMNSAVGAVSHTKPYVSPDTQGWVVANATLVPGLAAPHKALVHFELSIESFRQRMLLSGSSTVVQIVDTTDGRVVVDTRTPQRTDGSLGPGTSRVLPAAESGLVTSRDERIAYQRLDSAGNANDWAVVAMRPNTAALPVGVLLLLVAAGAAGIGLISVGAFMWRRAQQLLHHAARTDGLTDLPNRAAFARAADAMLTAAIGGRSTVAVLLCDLDRFKDVNDTLGHHIGDALLVEAGERLRGCVNASGFAGAVLARLGGDEFGVLVPGVDVDGASRLAMALRAAVNEPFDLLGLSVHVGVSVGIAVAPHHGDHLPELLQRADVAMYAAKRARLGQAVYTVGSDHHSRRRLSLAGELRDAFTRGELIAAYQPICEPATRAIVGVEALVRWRHPKRGLLQPAEFLTVADETGLIRELTPYILARVLVDARRWLDAGTPLRVSVNLTVHDLLDADFPARVATALAASGVPADLLCLEVTEQHLLEDRDTVLTTLHALRALGVLLAIDDYGTGYCGLAYLRDLPVDYVKIDRSFVQTMTTDHVNEIIVRSSMELAHRLGFGVVAEGVEDPDALPRLVSLGCELVQGFLLGEPMASGQLELLLTAMSSSDPTPHGSGMRA